jgi:hypothetical protein
MKLSKFSDIAGLARGKYDDPQALQSQIARQESVQKEVNACAQFLDMSVKNIEYTHGDYKGHILFDVMAGERWLECAAEVNKDLSDLRVWVIAKLTQVAINHV